MKYVILSHPTRLPIVAAGMMLTHAELAAPYQARGYVAKSAGFLRLLERDRFETFGYSDSLKLSPHADDARVLQALHLATLKTAPGQDTASSVVTPSRANAPRDDSSIPTNNPANEEAETTSAEGAHAGA